MTAAAHSCPCCGAALAAPSRLDAAIAAARLTPMQEKVVRVIARSPGLQGEEVAGVVYADCPDGGPLHARNLVAIHVMAARARLRAFGVDLGAGSRRRSGYFLTLDGGKHAG